MQPNEIRLGNVLFFPFHNQQVTITGYVLMGTDLKFKVQFETNGGLLLEELSMLNPIPLTTEILEACGLKKMELPKGEESYFGKGEYNFGNPVLYLNQYTYLATNGSNKYIFLDGFRIDCKYLHELQNLYYALTKTELIYNPINNKH